MSKLCVAVLLVLGACGTSKPSPSETSNLQAQAATTLNQMTSKDPSLPGMLSNSVAYAVFPSVGAAGALFAGGAYGKGILYEHGQPTGYVELKQGSVGLELGGQTFAQLLVLSDPGAVADLKAGNLKIGAGVTGVVLKTGAAAAARFESGTAVFIMPHGGLMAGIGVSGQTIAYRPLAG
jgi:lipid-binding SYLF domain-containing protein